MNCRIRKKTWEMTKDDTLCVCVYVVYTYPQRGDGTKGARAMHH